MGFIFLQARKLTSGGNSDYQSALGSTGIVARYVSGGWQLELGWVTTFLDQDNPGLWNDWVLGHGLHTKLRYSF